MTAFGQHSKVPSLKTRGGACWLQAVSVWETRGYNRSQIGTGRGGRGGQGAHYTRGRQAAVSSEYTGPDAPRHTARKAAVI